MNESEKEKMWGLLKRAIDKIQHKNNSELSFEELYRTAYQLVLHRYGDMAMLLNDFIVITKSSSRVDPTRGSTTFI